MESDSRSAAERINAENFDLVVADIRMPGLSGVDLLRLVHEGDPDLAVVMLTAFPSVETAVQSMKLGAADYLTKPFLPEDLLATARRLLTEKRLRQENRLLSRQVEKPYSFDEIIGQCLPMRQVFETIRRVAETSADVLILGETGTGKELVARSIHRRSRRAKGRFVPVDCGAIPENLLESELFGHERGAFTGAHERSLGLMELADQGTFFLDEIAELPQRLQSKFLRALQERCIRRVGGKDEIDVDVRIIAATSRDLDREVREDRFRQDLYYRVNVARIQLPPLRQRVQDIPLLVEYFAKRYAQEMERDVPQIDAEALEVLTCYPWPGNVRELQNILKRTLVMTRASKIGLDDLPEELIASAGDRRTTSGEGLFDLRERHTANFERQYLTNLLKNCMGEISEAARLAQIPRGTLYRLLKKHSLNPEDFRT
ncbi:sigma-54-dependent Fis family transcriptional regulator [Planctomycetales bacterium ZRK34]|nr:sigma-54-dependent Fis family transcriptional regulator [Planctomycetales bacterium ZRK34]